MIVNAPKTRQAKPDSVQEATSVAETAERMRRKLKGIVPEVEVTLKAELAFEINQLKRKLNAVVLGHNYMEPALYHSIPDFTGDSLELSRICVKTDADLIVFCGVRFMAETAKVLNPKKTVLIPSLEAGCSLSENITAEQVRGLRRIYKGAPVVSYVNTNADVKAESDYCCTSGNAMSVVRHLLEEGHERILFLPDEYLARNTANELKIEYASAPNELENAAPDAGLPAGRPVIIGWHARCEVHEKYTVQDVENARKQFPGVVILAHPECPPDVVAKVDYTGSTKGMIEYVRTVNAPRYLLFTECSMADNLAAEFPEREMVRACSFRCKHMNLITLEQTLASLQQLRHKVELPQDIIDRARKPIDRMLEIR
jgi:quinolinate synthase